MRRAAPSLCLLLAAVALAPGCKQGTLAGPAGAAPGAANVWQQQTQSLTSQLQDLNRRLSQLDANNRDLHSQLAQAEQQKQLFQNQITLMQKQLGETANKLKDSQVAKQEVEKRVEGLLASARARGSASITANSSVKQNLSAVQLPGLEVRQDGDVIRIELPGDSLFLPGTFQLQPSAVKMLDDVALAVQQHYPRQRIVVEGHTDNSSPATAHMLSGGQAQAVFQQLATRNQLSLGQLSILALGANHPRTSNATPAGKAKNRRVEVVIYPDTVDGAR